MWPSLWWSLVGEVSVCVTLQQPVKNSENQSVWSFATTYCTAKGNQSCPLTKQQTKSTRFATTSSPIQCCALTKTPWTMQDERRNLKTIGFSDSEAEWNNATTRFSCVEASHAENFSRQDHLHEHVQRHRAPLPCSVSKKKLVLCMWSDLERNLFWACEACVVKPLQSSEDEVQPLRLESSVQYKSSVHLDSTACVCVSEFSAFGVASTEAPLIWFDFHGEICIFLSIVDARLLFAGRTCGQYEWWTILAGQGQTSLQQSIDEPGDGVGLRPKQCREFLCSMGHRVVRSLTPRGGWRTTRQWHFGHRKKQPDRKTDRQDRTIDQIEQASEDERHLLAHKELVFKLEGSCSTQAFERDARKRFWAQRPFTARTSCRMTTTRWCCWRKPSQAELLRSFSTTGEETPAECECWWAVLLARHRSVGFAWLSVATALIPPRTSAWEEVVSHAQQMTYCPDSIGKAREQTKVLGIWR